VTSIVTYIPFSKV